MKKLILFGIMLTSAIGYSQSETDFFALLERAQVEFATPLETFLRKIKVVKTDLIEYDYSLKAKQDPVEIRYKIIPIDNEDPIAGSPQITVTQIASTIASNYEELGDIVFHRIAEQDLVEFNADFGVNAFLHPKKRFSDKLHCKIQFLYAEGKGMICTFLLFNKTDLDLSIYEKNLTFVKGI